MRTRPVVACEYHHPGAPILPGVRIHQLGVAARRLPIRPYPRALRALLAGLAVTSRARVLHAHFGYMAAHTGRVAERLGRPWVLSLHGHDLLVEGGSPSEPDLARRADLVVVPSRFLEEAAIGAGFPTEHVVVIPSGIDLASYRFRPRRPRADGSVVVSFAGRFVAKKGVLDAADALVEIVHRHPEGEARLVGFGPLAGQARARLGTAPVTMVDGAPQGAMVRALDETDLLVTPSRTAADGDAESLGLVNIEAQACGVPLVTTRHGGIPEAVHPDAGILVPEGDVEGLVTALERLLAQADSWPAMGAAGRHHVEGRFELDAQVAKIEEQ